MHRYPAMPNIRCDRIIFALFAVTLVAGLLPMTAMGQDDPFDPFEADTPPTATAAGDGSQPAPQALDQSLDEGVRLIVQSIRDADPKTPIDLARAIETLINVRQFEEAKRYLAKLTSLDASDQQLFELQRQMGPAFLLEIRSQPELLPESREFSDRALAAASRKAFEPERIDSLITGLSDDNHLVGRDSFRQLNLLGAPAAAAMLNATVDSDRRPEELPYIQRALNEMGASALLPLIGAARADGTMAQTVAIGALSSNRSQLAIDTLYRASISDRIDPELRAIAAEAAGRHSTGYRAEIERLIFDRANAYLDGDIFLPGDSAGNTVVWNWDFEQQQLRPTVVPVDSAARILAVDLARDLYRLNPNNPEYRLLFVTCVIDGTKRIIGPSRTVLVNEITRYTDSLSMAEADQALGFALQRKLVPAAIGAAELCGQLGDASLLVGVNSEFSNLVRAIMSGQRHLQFAAARSIAQLDPRAAFPGCSHVARIMVFMAASSGQPAVLLGHPRSESAQTLAASASLTPLQGLAANSPLEIIRELDSNPDITALLFTDLYNSPHYQELVQQIRNRWPTRLLPIGLTTRSDARERHAELVMDRDSLTLVMPGTMDSQLISGQVRRLVQLHQPWPITGVQLQTHSQVALDWLAKILAEPEVYRFYHINCYRDRLAQLLRYPGNDIIKAEILARLGTPASQRSLVTIASETSLPIGQRQVVAKAFSKSVRENGILLTRPEILLQYDRHNAVQASDPDSAEVLSGILDVIERR